MYAVKDSTGIIPTTVGTGTSEAIAAWERLFAVKWDPLDQGMSVVPVVVDELTEDKVNIGAAEFVSDRQHDAAGIALAVLHADAPDEDDEQWRRSAGVSAELRACADRYLIRYLSSISETCLTSGAAKLSTDETQES